MDYTSIFAQAIESKARYHFDELKQRIDAQTGLQCGDWDEWADNNWYRLCPETPVPYEKCYGFLCAAYPAALLTAYCPADLRQLLDENGVFCAEPEEPMACAEEILRQYVTGKAVFDEQFLNGAYDADDERFQMVLHRLETGQKTYIDAGSFTMEEIR